MPNWCSNNLRVMSPNSDVQEVINFVKANLDKNGEFKLNTLYPMPEELDGTTAPSNDSSEESKKLIEKYGYANWYDWRINNWGTKWDVTAYCPTIEEIQEEELTEVYIDFESAWAPPEGWFSKICDLYPKLILELDYEEPGMQFAGTMYNKNGMVEIEEREYEDDWDYDEEEE